MKWLYMNTECLCGCLWLRMRACMLSEAVSLHSGAQRVASGKQQAASGKQSSKLLNVGCIQALSERSFSARAFPMPAPSAATARASQPLALGALPVSAAFAKIFSSTFHGMPFGFSASSSASSSPAASALSAQATSQRRKIDRAPVCRVHGTRSLSEKIYTPHAT